MLPYAHKMPLDLHHVPDEGMMAMQVWHRSWVTGTSMCTVTTIWQGGVQHLKFRHELACSWHELACSWHELACSWHTNDAA
jgi:hypothetical protein